MPPITDTVATLATVATGSWCVTTMYAMHTTRVVVATAINRAQPCDLAAVLRTLPGVLGRINRHCSTMRGLA